MSDTDNENTNTDELPVVSELDALKKRADAMGISYHPSIGLEKLREKVNAAIQRSADEPAPVEASSEPTAPMVANQPAAAPVETDAQRRARKKREANELVRIRVTCMNPAKREWEGEIITAGNSLVGSFKKFIPFNAPEGWHVPRIIFNVLKSRECQIFVSEKDNRGGTIRRGKQIKEFAIEVLPPLTVEELKDLAQRQAMAKSIG